MNNGGHSSYFDSYECAEPCELIQAINIVAYEEIAQNYSRALAEGEEDEFEKTDKAYFEFSPTLCDCLQEYVEKNKDIIFN